MVRAVTIEQIFAAATTEHRMGRLVEAEALYREVLGWDGDHARSSGNISTFFG
jgi:hypothetical protein